MKFKTLLLRKQKGVYVLTLNRPEKLNAISALMSSEIKTAFLDLKEKAAPVVILAGSGRAFCAGVDLTEIKQRRAKDAFERRTAALFDEIESFPGVTIAAIHGPAYGGGVELSLACDLRFATPEAVFCLPEVKLGIIPSAGGLRRLPPLIGFSRAKQMILTASRINADEAADWGLIHHIEPGDSLINYCIKRGNEILKLNSNAVRAAKQLLNSAMNATYPERIIAESLAQALLFEQKAMK